MSSSGAEFWADQDRNGDYARAIEEVIRRRDRGEQISETMLSRDYPALMPALSTCLQSANVVRLATISANRAGAVSQPVRILSPEELGAPLHDDLDFEKSVPHRFPTIKGYRILSAIGEGGQAAVFKAEQEATGRIVAVKVIFGGPFVVSRRRSRFETEIAAMARLDHPNIVGILDRGCASDGSLFLVMNFVDGLPLDEFVAQRQLSVRQCLELFLKVTRAVQEAHRQGIIHRDLKPSNVLVDVRREPHVMDFGLARLDQPDTRILNDRSAHTLTGEIIGSLHWASPEIISGDGPRIDGRSDVYSLGVMFYKALTGNWPYDVTGSITETFKSILSRAAKPAILLRKDWQVVASDERQLEVGLDAVLCRALAKSPEDRQQSADELASETQRVLDGGRATRVRRRFAARTAAAASICFLLAVVIGVFALRPQPVAPVVLIQPSAKNALGISFVKLPPGHFTMGSPGIENGRDGDEQSRPVEITRPFYLSQYEITIAQYSQLMTLAVAVPNTPQNAPIDYVSWDEAQEFCKKLGAIDGRHYRLPTEAEWEYACRAGTQGPFNADIDRAAWYLGNSKSRLHSVGEKWPNAFGLFDMHGGVAEWCQDWYEPQYPGQGNQLIRDPFGPAKGTMRVVRGGSTFDDAMRCRSAARNKASPNERLKGVGFRIAMNAK